MAISGDSVEYKRHEGLGDEYTGNLEGHQLYLSRIPWTKRSWKKRKQEKEITHDLK